MKELLSSDPFGTGMTVPWLNFHDGSGPAVVSITQRHLAFIVANVLMGNDIVGGSGLAAAYTRCSKKNLVSNGYIFSSLSLLAVLSVELAGGSSGTTLVGAKPGPATDSWKQRLDAILQRPNQICKEIGTDPTDPSVCTPGDFMSGGTNFQAMTDIAGGVVGGGAELCDLALSQDESLVQFYSEVLAFSFFVSANKQQLPVPWTLLGARRYLNFLSGQTTVDAPFYNVCGYIPKQEWLNENIGSTTVSTTVDGEGVAVAASTFVAVASMGEGSYCSIADMQNNNCDHQRRHLDEDINLWYQAFQSRLYHTAVQRTFESVVTNIGTGPWGSGVWFGDSQQYLLTMWLATGLLQGPQFSYYIYDNFCENPGNQCFVLGRDSCTSCVLTSRYNSVKASRCGQATMTDMFNRFAGGSAQTLYSRLLNVGPPPTQIFDLLASADAEVVV
jgi:hypothetical protein